MEQILNAIEVQSYANVEGGMANSSMHLQEHIIHTLFPELLVLLSHLFQICCIID